MSSKALKIVVAAEEEARQAMRSVQENAKLALEGTEQAGKEAIAATLIRAETEVAHLLRVTDSKAMEEARDLASKTANRQAAQRARAERLLGTAADLIIERIVNG